MPSGVRRRGTSNGISVLNDPVRTIRPQIGRYIITVETEESRICVQAAAAENYTLFLPERYRVYGGIARCVIDALGWRSNDDDEYGGGGWKRCGVYVCIYYIYRCKIIGCFCCRRSIGCRPAVDTIIFSQLIFSKRIFWTQFQHETATFL